MVASEVTTLWRYTNMLINKLINYIETFDLFRNVVLLLYIVTIAQLRLLSNSNRLILFMLQALL